MKEIQRVVAKLLEQTDKALKGETPDAEALQNALQALEQALESGNHTATQKERLDDAASALEGAISLAEAAEMSTSEEQRSALLKACGYYLAKAAGLAATVPMTEVITAALQDAANSNNTHDDTL